MLETSRVVVLVVPTCLLLPPTPVTVISLMILNNSQVQYMG